jgi:hypothetical protein
MTFDGSNLCADGCGEPAATRGYSRRCYRRWYDQGFPEGGPRWPMTALERGRRSAQARAPKPDPYDLEWLAGAPERRIRRVRPQVADLVRCVAARDGAGVGRLLEKITDTEAAFITLAECADPVRTAIVCGPALAVVGTTASPAGEAPRTQQEAGSVDQGADDAAA